MLTALICLTFFTLSSASDQIYSNATLSLTLSSHTNILSVKPSSTVKLHFILTNHGEAGRFIVSQQSRFGLAGTLSLNSLYLATGRQVTLQVSDIHVGGREGDRKDFGVRVEREHRGRNRESQPDQWNNGGHGGRPDGNNGGNHGNNDGFNGGDNGGRPDWNNGGHNGGRPDWNNGGNHGNNGGFNDGDNGRNPDWNNGGHNGGRPDGNNGGHNGGRPDGNNGGHNGGRPDGNNGGHNGGRPDGNNGGHNGGRPDGNNGGHNGGRPDGNNGGHNGGRPDGNNGGHNGGRPDGNNGGHPDWNNGGNNGGFNGGGNNNWNNGNNGGRPDGNNGWNDGKPDYRPDGDNGGNGWNDGRPNYRSSIEKMVEFHLSNHHESDRDEPLAAAGYVENGECEEGDSCRNTFWTAPFSAEDPGSGLWSVKFEGGDVVFWHDPIMTGSTRAVTGRFRVNCCTEEVEMKVKDVAGMTLRSTVSRGGNGESLDIVIIFVIIGAGILALTVLLVGGVCLCKKKYSTVSQNDA